MNNVLEVESQQQEGAKINLTVDLAPEDCFLMCQQLFSRLKDYEKEDIMNKYLSDVGKSTCQCSSKDCK